MDILLIAGPVIEPTQPALAVPTLAAYIRSKGFEVRAWDLNIECFHVLLSEPFLRNSLERMNNRSLHGDEHEMQRYRRAVLEAEVLGQSVLEKVEEAKGILRDKEKFYDLNRYRIAFCVLTGAFKILHAGYFPTRIRFTSYDISHVWTVPAILSHCSDGESNIFLDYFCSVTIPRIREQNPPLIAISVTYESQFLPCLTLCRLLRRHLPDIPVILGGAYITTIADRLESMEFIWDLVSGIVLYEGESALAEICHRVKKKKDFSDIPNLFTKSDKGTIRTIIQRKTGDRQVRVHIEDMKDLPSPDFSGFPLDHYLVPEPVLPVQSSRGCYWGKCAFCAVSIATRQSFRQRPLAQFLSDLQSLHASTGATIFSLCNDATPVNFLKGLARSIKNEKLPYHWATEARLEPGLDPAACQLIADGGCRHLLFGFESASDRVLSLMRKGTCVEETIPVLEACRKADLGVTLYSFIGFPGETAEEARMTGNFFEAHPDLYTNVTITTFSAMLGSEIVRHPDRYDVSVSCDPEVIARDCAIEVHHGMSSSEADLQLKKILHDLYLHDVAVDRFFYIHGTAHWLLYLRKFGRTGFQALWEHHYTLHDDLNKTYLTAGPDIRFQMLNDEEELLYNSGCCHKTIKKITANAIRSLQQRPQPLVAIAFEALGKNPRHDTAAQLLLSTVMFELFLLVKQKFLHTAATTGAE